MSPDASASKSFFRLANQKFEVPFRPAWVMGIVNVTPDSFSDGGLYLDRDAAVELALRQVKEGARIIDIGAESTRPGSAGVPPAEQIRRVVPVIEDLRARNTSIAISIDTCSAKVAHAALRVGANMINDTSALRDDEAMAGVAAESGASVILMHRKGTPRDMQDGGGPVYADLISEITDFLNERISLAIRAGIDRTQIVIDPGIGFGKQSADNLRILKHVRRFADLGFPVLIGASRKRFIGELLNVAEPRERAIGSVACAAIAATNDASIIRAHDVFETVHAIQMIHAVAHGPSVPIIARRA